MAKSGISRWESKEDMGPFKQTFASMCRGGGQWLQEARLGADSWLAQVVAVRLGAWAFCHS